VSLDRELLSGSCRLVDGVPGLEDVADVVAQSQERFDGLGLPKGLKGRSARLEARILRIALGMIRLGETSTLPSESWLAHLELEAGAQYDPELLGRLGSRPHHSWAEALSP